MERLPSLIAPVASASSIASLTSSSGSVGVGVHLVIKGTLALVLVGLLCSHWLTRKSRALVFARTLGQLLFISFSLVNDEVHRFDQVENLQFAAVVA